MAKRARSAPERTASNPALEFFERLGYVVRGVLYATMGGLALGVAFGIGGSATDPSGSLAFLTSNGAGRFLLVAVVAGLAAYACWGFVRAIFDPLHRGDAAPGIAERLGFAWSGIAYTSLVLFALRLLAGHSPSHRDGTQMAIASVLSWPGGNWLAVGIGLVTLGVGIGQLVDGFRATFKKDLKRTQMKKWEKELVDNLGRIGMLSRGVTFSLVGWFVVQGGLHQDASLVHGYGGAFVFLLEQPYGQVLLAAVAIGFIALGLHSLACARWIRLLSEER